MLKFVCPLLFKQNVVKLICSNLISHYNKQWMIFCFRQQSFTNTFICYDINIILCVDRITRTHLIYKLIDTLTFVAGFAWAFCFINSVSINSVHIPTWRYFMVGFRGLFVFIRMITDLVMTSWDGEPYLWAKANQKIRKDLYKLRVHHDVVLIYFKLRNAFCTSRSLWMEINCLTSLTTLISSRHHFHSTLCTCIMILFQPLFFDHSELFHFCSDRFFF